MIKMVIGYRRCGKEREIMSPSDKGECRTGVRKKK